MRNFVAALAIVAPVVAVAAAGIALQDRLAGSDRDNEGALLAASGGLAHREGPSLALVMETGAVIVLTDRIVCGDLPCPGPVAARYRYRGWDATAGGHRILVGMPSPAPMVLPWDMPWDRPALIDADHAPPRAAGPLDQPSPPPSVAPDIGLADWLGQAESDRDAVETPHLAESGGRVARTGATLTLKLGDGRVLALTDDLVCGQLVCPPQIVQAFGYLGGSPDGRFHVVADHWYEGGLALLIDAKSGGATIVAGPPQFSPDGKRAAAGTIDPETRGPRDLEIWSLAGAVPVLEFAVKGGAGQDLYDIVGWDDADHLRLRHGPLDAPQRVPIMLAHAADGWHLEGGN